jgi:hypothetical protein
LTLLEFILVDDAADENHSETSVNQFLIVVYAALACFQSQVTPL